MLMKPDHFIIRRAACLQSPDPRQITDSGLYGHYHLIALWSGDNPFSVIIMLLLFACPCYEPFAAISC